MPPPDFSDVDKFKEKFPKREETPPFGNPIWPVGELKFRPFAKVRRESAVSSLQIAYTIWTGVLIKPAEIREPLSSAQLSPATAK